MKKTMLILTALLGVSLLFSCEKVAIPEEDSMFIVEAVVADASADGVRLDLSLREGTTKGDCRAEFSIRNLADGTTPPYEVLLGGDAAISPSAPWSFGDDGRAHFIISGVPAGSYAGTVKVTRWYHTSTDRFSFTISN